MNRTKSFFLTALLAIAAHFGLAQHKEEMYSVHPDPIRSVQIFPNPAVDFLTVRLDQPSIKKTRLAVLNVIGNEVEFESEFMDENEVKIKVKDLPTGYYFLSIRDEHATFRSTFKFLKR